MSGSPTSKALSELESHLIPLEGAASVLSHWIGDTPVNGRPYVELPPDGLCWLAWEIFHEVTKIRECFEQASAASMQERKGA